MTGPRFAAAVLDEFNEPTREQFLLTPTHTVGLPVHAIDTLQSAGAPGAVMELLQDKPAGAVLVTFVNPATVKQARQDPGFARNLHAFDLVLPDGIGFCFAIRLLHGVPAARVSFDMTSLAPAVFDHARRKGWKLVLVGGQPGVTARARDQLERTYPDLIVAGVFDGYGDMAATTRLVCALQPKIVVCGMGAVRQEAFLLGLKALGWKGWGFTCGGFLDQLQADLVYYPAWIDRADLRWAYRLFREPGRLWRRYLLDYSEFGLMLTSALRRKALHARSNV